MTTSCTPTPLEAKRVDLTHAVIYDAHGMIFTKMAPSEQAFERAEEVAARYNSHDALVAALEEMTPQMPPIDAWCHKGIVTQKRCANCQRIARARAAIKAAKGAP